MLVNAADGSLLGAVGVSGDTSDHDEEAALAGIESAGWWVRSTEPPAAMRGHPTDSALRSSAAGVAAPAVGAVGQRRTRSTRAAS